MYCLEVFLRSSAALCCLKFKRDFIFAFAHVRSQFYNHRFGKFILCDAYGTILNFSFNKKKFGTDNCFAKLR